MSDWVKDRQRERDLYYKELIADAANSPLWQGYVDYCKEGERGLRRVELAKLELFVAEMEKASFE